MPGQPRIATFSIVARDPATGDLGVGVQSKFPAVGAVVPWARAGVGAIATQADANIRFGPDGLDLLAQGLDAEATMRQLLAADDHRDHRQLGIVDDQGNAVAWTGSSCMSWAGHITGPGFAAQGNILTGAEVVADMARAFEQTSGELAERLVAALDAAQAAGGDKRGRQAAALYVARPGGSYGGNHDRYIDLRVDDHPDPIVELGRLLQLHRFYMTPPGPADMFAIDAAMSREILSILRDVGFFNGDVEGPLDEVAIAALQTYGGVENIEMRLGRLDAGMIDQTTLDFLRRKGAEARASSVRR